MFDKGKINFVSYYGGNVTVGQTLLRYLEMYNLIGDPSITTRSNEKVVLVDQQRNDGSRLSGTSVGHWNGTTFLNLNITSSPDTINGMIGSREVLKDLQDTVSNPIEKYIIWNNFSNIRNHRDFYIDRTLNELISNYKPTHTGITIKNELIDAPSQNFGSINFKDPWLVDTTDSRFFDAPYGYRNLGMGAPFKTESSPFYPTTTSKYKGVFLNQRSDIPGNPYYTVRVPLAINHRGIMRYFQYWSADSAAFANSSENLTGFDTKAVIFKGANDIVKAVYKGHRMSSTNLALAGNNQRKLVYGKK